MASRRHPEAKAHLAQIALARAMSMTSSEKNSGVSVPLPSAHRGNAAPAAEGLGSVSSVSS